MKRLLFHPLPASALLLAAAAVASCAVATAPESDAPPPTTRERLVRSGAELDVVEGSTVELELHRGDEILRLEVATDGFVAVAAAPDGHVLVTALDLSLGRVGHGGGIYPDGFILRDTVLRNEAPHWCRSVSWTDDVCDAELTTDLLLEAELWAGDGMWIPLTIPVEVDIDLLLYDDAGATAGYLQGRASASAAGLRTLPLGLPDVALHLDLHEQPARTVIY